MFSNPEKNIAQFQIGKGMSIADFGVGNGAYTLACAAAVGEEGTVYAFDIQKDLLKKIVTTAATLGFKNIHTIWSNLEEDDGTTLNDETVDAVILSNILFQIEHKEGIIAEAFRILRKGGRMLVIDWQDSESIIGPHKDQIIPLVTTRALISAAGFSYERDIDAGLHHYGIVARKQKL